MKGAQELAALAHALCAPAMLERVRIFVEAGLQLSSAEAATAPGGPHNALDWLATCHRVG